MSSVPERVKVEDGAPSGGLCNRVGAILARGGLVVLPTETVYGIAARADLPLAVEALGRAKGRPAELAMTWHVGNPSALERLGTASAAARRPYAASRPGAPTARPPRVP